MKQESTQATSVNALNRAKMYQLVLFPMNNGATNVYYILTMNFIAYYANGVLGLLLAFATTMVTLMRAGDAFIDPIIGAIMDRTSTKWGKFRPFMVIGNLIMIVSSILLYFGTRIISEDMMWLRYLCFILFYALNMVGYTFQTTTIDPDNPMARSMNSMNYIMPLFSVFMGFALPAGLGLYWAISAIVRCVQQMAINKYLSKKSVEEMIEEQRKKAAKKREKKGAPAKEINRMATKSTRNVTEQKTSVSSKEKEEKIQQAKENIKNAKPGSLASKANMVSRYNSGHNAKDKTEESEK